MAGQVVVQDVNELSGYCRQLAGLKEELEASAGKLTSLAEEIEETAGMMKAATESQGSNWQDPQYERLREDVDPVVDVVRSTADSMKDTASVIRAKMAEVDDSVLYIESLVAKLSSI